ncbi:hypothetical protein PLICRDRAFT_179547 [Plicaturopsis crispa FD-325 SS-3]|uniref:Uncharacterized protein n=1 Tax=Plicaturopsis crispa FD-325 SS-3 TaxID=944288 RepID=A0A0C9SR35_PLICR|nr:hypothetical protein PLICRDRAFT_179547 [Plicaturopsis crispa FD-325 SS-3]
MYPTAIRLSKASRRPLTPKRGNKDYYKGTRQAALPGGLRTGPPGKHIIGGKGSYRLLDTNVRVFVAPPFEHVRDSLVRVGFFPSLASSSPSPFSLPSYTTTTNTSANFGTQLKPYISRTLPPWHEPAPSWNVATLLEAGVRAPPERIPPGAIAKVRKAQVEDEEYVHASDEMGRATASGEAHDTADTQYDGSGGGEGRRTPKGLRLAAPQEVQPVQA